MFSRTIYLLMCAGFLALISCGPLTAEQESPGPASSPLVSDLKVAFKLDSNLTKGVYMGDRWVSPPTYTNVQEGNVFVVEAKALGVVTAKEPATLDAEWQAEDPQMVTVAKGENGQVTITIHKEGESVLNVVSDGISKELAVKATYGQNTIQAEIKQ